MQLAVVAGIIILFCFPRAAINSSNLTMTLAASNIRPSLQNKSAVGVILTVADAKHLTEDEAPLVDDAAEVPEGSKVSDKWETGILVVIAVIIPLMLYLLSRTSF